MSGLPRERIDPAPPAETVSSPTSFAHVSQQHRSGTPIIACSVEEWLESSRPLQAMTDTELQIESDELKEWVDRQTESSAELSRIQEVLVDLGAELDRRNAQAALAGRPAQRPRRRRGAAPEPALPARRPRILTALTSVSYADPAELREEYDLIMQWLRRTDLSREERRVLEAEQTSLSPLIHAERGRLAGARAAARLRLSLTPEQSNESAALAALANVIEGIAVDPANPELFYIYDHGERVPISRGQRDKLRATLRDQLDRAVVMMSGRVDEYWGRYNAQVEINEEHPIVSAISGWLGDVDDPGEDLAQRVVAARQGLNRMHALVKTGSLREAGSMLARFERDTQESCSLARVLRGLHRRS